MVSRDIIIMFRSLVFPVKRLIYMITNGENVKYDVSIVCYRGATYFWPLNMVYPLKNNSLLVSRHGIIMFRSQIFPVKRLIFMITNGANEKYEVSKVCYRGATYFWPLNMVYPPKTNNIMVSLDVIIMFRS
jgi:hypothetical protein